MTPPYTIVAGTFDVLHVGHKRLLQEAFALGNNVQIGLTTDEYANSKRHRIVRPYGQRYAQLLTFFKTEGYQRYEIFPLNDPIGKATDPDATHIVCTPETYYSAMTINFERLNQGQSSLLTIVVVPMSLDSNGKEIHASRIVNGECTAEGFSVSDYKKPTLQIFSRQSTGETKQ